MAIVIKLHRVTRNTILQITGHTASNSAWCFFGNSHVFNGYDRSNAKNKPSAWVKHDTSTSQRLAYIRGTGTNNINDQSTTTSNRFSTNTSDNGSSVDGLSCLVIVDENNAALDSSIYLYKENNDVSSPQPTWDWKYTMYLRGDDRPYHGLSYIGYDTIGIHKYLLFNEIFTETEVKDIVYLTKPAGR